MTDEENITDITTDNQRLQLNDTNEDNRKKKVRKLLEHYIRQRNCGHYGGVERE